MLKSLSDFSVVNDADSLALGSGDGLRGYESDLGFNAEHGLQAVYESFLAPVDLAQVIGEHLRSHFDVDIQCVRIVNAIYDDLVICRIAEAEKDGLDL